MKRFLQFALGALRHGFGIIGSFALWTVWLGLILLLALQLYILTSSELAVPAFALRRIEARLAESGLKATFTRTVFDPTGRILAENVRLSLPNFPEPVVAARSVYIRLNPWMLLLGSVEPREIQIVGASASVPSMLSPSGRPAEIISQLEATLEPTEKALGIRQLSGLVAGVVVSARGTLPLERRAEAKPFEELIHDFVQNRFALLCRQALRVADHARQFEQPEILLELAPSESGAASASLTLLARRARLDQPFAARATELRARTRVLLFGANPTSWLEFSAAELELPGDVRARGLRGDVYGRFQDGAFFFEPRELTLTADSVDAEGTTVRAISTQAFPRPLPRVDVETVARVADKPLAVRGSADLKARQARAEFHGEIAPAILVPLSRRLGVDVRKYFDFTQLIVDHGEVRLGDGWKFERLAARVRLDGVNAYGVPMTDGRAVVELDPTRFYSPDAFARIGDNFARGSYEQDLRSLEYRFLLDGRLRPLELSPWFHDWWPNFFKQLEFPAVPPTASVDVRGIWRHGDQNSVFVFADAAKPILRGKAFDRALTRLFIRPGFFDGLELFLSRGEGFGRGRFTFVLPREGDGWDSFDFAAESKFDLATLADIGGEPAKETLEPFRLSQAPSLLGHGRFFGPAAKGGERYDFHLEARTSGDFFFHHFPLHDASFIAKFKDDEVSIDNFQASLAQGAATGHVRVWGKGDDRRLGFDVALNDASLGLVAYTAQEFFARQKGQPPPPPGKFVQEKANVKLDLAASAEGRYRDPLSYRGEGNVSLKGPEIAEIPLLGLLSELLKFTSLRFTEADANFKIEHARVTFPEMKIRGSNAAIEAHGNYVLDRRELEFNAKIFPFQESENLIKTVVGAVLTPLSNAFEVKLTGSLEKPEWSFVMAPTNLLRALAPGDAPDKNAPPREGPPPAPPANGKNTTPAPGSRPEIPGN